VRRAFDGRNKINRSSYLLGIVFAQQVVLLHSLRFKGIAPLALSKKCSVVESFRQGPIVRNITPLAIL
jgi:hypothetical protein